MTTSNIRIPEYQVEDSDEQIVIRINAPLSKLSETSFILDKKLFTFISNPYFLKINLQYTVFDIPDEQEFNPDTATYTIKLRKVNENDDTSPNDPDVQEKTEQFPSDGRILQSNSGSPIKKEFYGFANKYSNMFGKLADAFSDVINLPNPDSTNSEARRKLRLQEETKKWNDDHYLADTMETDHLEMIFKYKPPWIISPVKELDEDKMDILKSCNTLKNTELVEASTRLSELQIVDILFCYAYDKRTNEGDDSVESGWTINKLSSTLSWFEVFKDMKDVFIACYRRSLIYPLYRNWHLCELVHADVANILAAGSAQVTHSLLEVKEVFDQSENRYILNTIYLNNLCWFAHQMTSERFLELSKEVMEIKIKKYEVNHDLPLLEVAAHLTLEEEAGGSVKDISNIVNEIAKLKLERGETSSSTSSSSSSDSSDSSDSEETDSTQPSDNDG
ncbi:hypothetical protein RUM43_012977 [Polyplax serrata]|uniref:Protein SHQ1 homolog n=1 Tax=Polyplax serrata TaxID=468196 RepID=A0AAN8PT78_POLSC